MTRLQSELQRLYLAQSPLASAPATENDSLIDLDGRVRAMVLVLARPADWTALSLVWQAVQADLALPAPAIAVSGTDGYQLWFSLEEAVPTPQAHAFLESLRERYLSHIALARVDLRPPWDAAMLPVQQVLTGQWSAFVAPDLAPIFSETPWLDIPPSPDGQAELLSRLKSIKPAAWQAALAKLRPASALTKPELTSASPEANGPNLQAQRFLLQVMNDETVELALRIEAAKGLLPHPESAV